MSIRTLIEINHDFTGYINSDALDVLRLYLASGDHERYRDPLRRFGIMLIASRHHSTDYRLPDKVEGLPDPPKGADKP